MKLTFWPFWATLLIFIALICIWTPFFSLMDDIHFLSMAESVHSQGLISFTRQLIPGDLAYAGRFRPFVPSVAYLIYGVIPGNVFFLYLWNGVLTFLVLAFLSSALKRFWLEIQPETNDRSLGIFIFCLLLIYPWTHLFFALPSLHEKPVLFALAIALYVFTSQSIHARPFWIKLSLYCFVIFLGSIVREQFLIFFPLLLASSYAKQKKLLSAQTLLIFLFMLAVVFEIWLLGRSSEYKSKYGLGNIQNTLTHAKSFWLLLSLATAAVVKALLQQKTLKQKLLHFSPAISLVGFLCLMAPWGMGGYLNTVAAPAFALTLLCLAPSHLNARLRHLFFGFTVVVFSSQLYVDMRTKHDLGTMLGLPELKALAQTHQIFAPCSEGVSAMNTWADRVFHYHLGAKEAVNLHTVQAQNTTGLPSIWLVGPHLGCWPDDFDPKQIVKDGRAKVLWQGFSTLSFRILAIDN